MILILLTILLSAPLVETSPSSSSGSAAFDFWLGRWTGFWTDGDGTEGTGTNTITRELGGHVITEMFRVPATGFEGRSVSVYDSASDTWRQTWVDNSGGYLDFTGSFKDGVMELSRVATRKENTFLQRMQWYNLEPDRFDWNWERSDDKGETWKTLWHIRYVRIDSSDALPPDPSR